MEIKKNLKAWDVKISRLASGLGVSRPTLDSYIELFEKGEKIPNSAYQKIFEYLFSNENMTSIEFSQKYDYVKRVMLNDLKDKTVADAKTQRTEAIKEKIHQAVSSPEITEDLLEFLNLFITNYNVNLVKVICKYFNFTNGFIEMDEDKERDEDKALYSQLFKLFDGYAKKVIPLDEESFGKFVEKNKMMVEKKNSRITDDTIIEYIKNNVSDAKDIDYDLLRQMLERKEK